MKFFPIRTLFLCLSAAFALAPAAHAVTVVNGGFETGDFTGWTLTGAADFIGVDTQSPQAGTYSAYFGSNGAAAGLSQTIATTASQAYTVSFWLKSEADPNGVSAPNLFSFSWGGVPVVSVTNLTPGAYALYSYNLVATSASTSLAFSFRDDPAFFDLDSVAVNAVVTSVPEPGSVALMAGGGLALLGYRRRQHARSARAVAAET